MTHRFPAMKRPALVVIRHGVFFAINEPIRVIEGGSNDRLLVCRGCRP
jgi:hypothetical protein